MAQRRDRPRRCSCSCRIAVLPILVAACQLLLCMDVAAAGVLTADSFSADMTLSIKGKSRKLGPEHTIGPLPTGLAWDGSHFYTSAGGDVDTANLLRWCAKGTCIKDYGVPHLDIRSIWVAPAEAKDGSPVLYADIFQGQEVYRHTGGGKFEATGVRLQGRAKDVHSRVLFRAAALPNDPKAGVLVAADGSGSLLEYNAGNGQFLRTVAFRNFGAEPGESEFPNYVQFTISPLNATYFHYLTYAAGRLHAWSPDGQRVGGATLVGAAYDEMACHSISFAKGRAWVQDPASGTWHGYKLAFAQPQAPAAHPKPGAHGCKQQRPGALSASHATPGDEVCPMAAE